MIRKYQYKGHLIDEVESGIFDITEFASGELVDGDIRGFEEAKKYIDSLDENNDQYQSDVQAAFDGLVQTPQC